MSLGKKMPSVKMRNILALLCTSAVCALYRAISLLGTEPFWKEFLLFLLLFAFAGALIYMTLQLVLVSLRERVLSAYQFCEEKVNEVLGEKSIFLIVWFILTVFYIPAYIAFFPGIFGYDTPVQVAMFYGDALLTAHHPIAHTVLLGFFFRMGEFFFHSCQIGFAVYSAIQGLIVTASLAYAFSYLKKRKVPIIVIVLGILYAALNPLLQIIAFNVTKDVLFGAFLLCFVVSLLNILEEREAGLFSYVRFCFFGVMMCLFRNQGIYILFFSGILLLLMRIPRKKIYICILTAFFVADGFFVFCSKGLKIPEGDKREMLCVPMQQAAYVAYCHINGIGDASITQEQLGILEEVILEEGLLGFSSDSVDPVKTYFNTEAFMGNIGKHIKNYFELGIQNPEFYRDAWFRLIFPYWNLNSNEYLEFVFDEPLVAFDRWDIHQADIFPSYKEHLISRVIAIETDDGMSLFAHQEFCLWLLAILLGLAIARRDKKLAAGIVPYILYMGTMLLGPVALFRYLFPLTLATPLFLGFLFPRGR